MICCMLMWPIPFSEDWQGCSRPDCCYSTSRLMKMTCSPENDLQCHHFRLRRRSVCLSYSTYHPCNADMDKNGGMLAVVQALQDSSLTVTLLDGGKQYTLMPNDHTHQPNPVPLRGHPSVNCASQYTAEEYLEPGGRNRENGSQAVDGRYASTYKMVHCNVKPTSPPQTVTEFPPQRPEVVHGHGNFVIGGYGSGETARPAVKTNGFRGGMVWPDKGSVCASRASMQSDAFANSLRKYPNISPERSSEIVERLISFTQARNLSKNQNTRPSVDSESSKQTFVVERNCSKTSDTSKVYPDVMARKMRPGGSSPVKERSNEYPFEENDESWNRAVFCKRNDARCFKDTVSRVRQGLNNLVPPTNHRSPSRTRECYDCEIYHRRIYEQESNNSVNMEIQAAAQMESKEMLTLPRIVPMQRTVATPFTPISSKADNRKKIELKSAPSSFTNLSHACSCKSIQVKLPLAPDVNVTPGSFKKKNKSNERSRSQEELSNKKKEEPNSVLSFLQDVNPDVNELFGNIKRPIGKMRRICQKCKLLFDEFDVLRRSVSNNTYFRDNYQFNIHEQHASKHFIEMSKRYRINGRSQVYKNQYNNCVKQQLEYQPEYLSHVDPGNSRIPNDMKFGSKFTESSNKSRGIQNYFNSVDLMDKSVDKEIYRDKVESYSRCYNCCDDNFGDEINNNNILAMTQEEFRNLIDLDILAFTEKYCINITTESLYNLIEELFDVFVRDFNKSLTDNKTHVTERIKKVLRNRGLSEYQSICLTNILIEHWEDDLMTSNLKSSKFKSETLFVFPITQNSSEYKQDEHGNIDDHDFSINEISQKDIDSNVEVYINQISNEVNEWLTSLQLPEVQDNEMRQAIITDLATDIVDRHKYLELNPSTEISEASELEHLKYQIFKLNYRLGISNMTLVDRAVDLMKRIQSITAPTFILPESQDRKLDGRKRSSFKVEPKSQSLRIEKPSNLGASSSRKLSLDNDCCNKPKCKRSLNKKRVSDSTPTENMSLKKPEGSYQKTASTRRISTPGKSATTIADQNVIEETSEFKTNKANGSFKKNPSPTNNIPNRKSSFFSAGIKIRDEEDDTKNQNNGVIKTPDLTDFNNGYSKYLKEWVEKIPLPITSVEDQTATRTDVYNSVLEIVTKLRSEPDAFNNRFLFEDKLDDEIGKIISKLPQTPELNSKKHILKVKLIEKITDDNDFIKSSLPSYKQQLVENIKGNLHKSNLNGIDDSDVLEIYEELQILNIVEDFIICSRFHNQDPVAEEAYRKKLKQRSEKFIEELKAEHGKALKDIDMKVYINDIVDMLKSIPKPSDETIQEEAEEILLSIEIDKWFSDLPLVQNNDFVEQLHRRRLRYNLAKQIFDMEKVSGNTANISDDSLKHEISQFLEKAPLKQGESLHINSMADDLIKRLKNIPTSIGNDSKKVIFNEPNYEGFCRNMPLCSTYTEHTNKDVEKGNKSVLSTKSIQATDPSPMHNGNYHNISKPLFDDLRKDQSCCNSNLSMQEVPNYETFNTTRPRSSSLKDNVEPHWYTLQESTREYKQSDMSLNTKNQNKMEQSNKSIQAISPNRDAHGKYYHNIAQPLLDDLRSDRDCCSNLPDDGIRNGDRRNMLNGDTETNWYTLQDSEQEYLQPNTVQSPSIPRYSANRQQFYDPNTANRGQCNIPEHHFIVPQHYLEEASNDYEEQQRHDVSYDNRRNSPRTERRDSMMHYNEHSRRSINNTRSQQRWPNPDASPRRGSSPRCKKRQSLDHFASPHRVYHPMSPKEPSRRISNHSPGFQPVELKGPGPQLDQSGLFYKSTDQDGIRRTIEHNKSREANLDNTPERSEYCTPSVLLPPCYIPVRVGTTKGHMHRNIEERFAEDSVDENEEDEIQCRCVEKLWKSKRRPRHCPFEKYDGYPMCLTSPYFYSYFY